MVKIPAASVEDIVQIRFQDMIAQVAAFVGKRPAADANEREISLADSE